MFSQINNLAIWSHTLTFELSIFFGGGSKIDDENAIVHFVFVNWEKVGRQ